VIEDDISMDDNDDHSCSSLDTSLISDKVILVKEDAIIENHEYLSFPYPIPLYEDIMAQ
jgi:hypothetical protein